MVTSVPEHWIKKLNFGNSFISSLNPLQKEVVIDTRIQLRTSIAQKKVRTINVIF